MLDAVLLTRAPADGNEARLDWRDGAARTAIVALHEVQPVLLLQRRRWRLARRAGDVLADVSPNNLLNRFRGNRPLMTMREEASMEPVVPISASMNE